MALYHFTANVLSRSGRNTVRAVAYRAGCQLVDSQTAEIFNYKNKDVQHVELLLPKDAPSWAVDIQKVMAVDRQKGVQSLCDIVERAETRINSQVWREFEFALHRELSHEQNMALAREFIQDQICSRGMAAQLNFHVDIEEKTGLEKPHCHVLVTTRLLSEEGMGAKEREWNKKEFLCELRQQWQDYSNFHLKLHGHDIRIDHRCNKERGIEMEPQPKMGKGAREQEKRAQALEGENTFSPITDKAKTFHDVQLRNLYRIMRKPDVVLDIATKHHTTFMWADVQKVLHRYVDDIALFQRLELRLKNSKELILLRPVENEKEKAIYTTRTMLKAEKLLVEGAEALDRCKTHAVEELAIVRGISSANGDLKKKGFDGLSQDQVKAIYHMSDGGQLKCMVGIAGAGKTTALQVCQDIWKESGYAVYGLAPTGKAAQNLEQGGISSSTLHKFLNEFDKGKCQYTEKSILVLDEAGMVDVERFSQLVGAVKQLGVKLIVVGDGAQLQPVEAGPAFRLVTERLGKSELHTVIRQKEEWQREATVLFGKQYTQEAIQTYADRGHVHIVEERLVSLNDVLKNNDREAIVKLYEVSKRTSSLMYREMAEETNGSYERVKEHQDFKKYLYWKGIEKKTAHQIIQNGDEYKPLLETRCLDPLKMALLFVNKQQDKVAQHEEAVHLLEKNELKSLIGIGRLPGQSVDVRQETKLELVKAWHANFTDSLDSESPDKTVLMMAFSNRDMNDLNKTARSLLKQSGHLSKKECIYAIKREEEDDFGRKYTTSGEKAFAKGDQIVFTQNNNHLDVKNGTLGIITDLTKQTVRVKREDGKEISFAPNLNPYFDQGWAITIHKSQGSTVDRAYVLASYEMTQNLAYVSMTRHREDVQIFGSSLDFWRPEKLPEVLSKSGEKLVAADYLDARSLNQLMQEDDKLITKIFTRVSNELEAMGVVSKKVFWQVANHFLGITREKEIKLAPEISHEGIREEIRAEALLKRQDKAFTAENISYSQNIAPHSTKKSSPQIWDAKIVENALKQNMASFADDIFSSIGEPYNSATSSRTEHRYGKKGHIAVNLKTGAWINYKDSDKAGGPLHMLTKLKGLGFKEAVEYGASWAGLSQAELSKEGLPRTRAERVPSTQHNPLTYLDDKEETKQQEADRQAKIAKAQALWDKGRPIQGTTAEQYLREHRKIEDPLSDELRYLPFFKDVSSQMSFPCLMAGARSQSGEITAVQLTFLNADTAAKANIEVSKKSFGVIKGSSVTLQEDKGSNILFIAEGVETALSLKSAGIQGTIKASLGLSNVKRIVSESFSRHIVICADHDAADSPAITSLQKSVHALEDQGYTVTVIKPEKLNQDFNDVLALQGPEVVRDILQKGFPKELLKIVLPERELPLPSPAIETEPNTDKIEPETDNKKFQQIIHRCEKRLYDLLERNGTPLTPERMTRIPLQAERTATYIMHSHGLNRGLPSEAEMVQFSMRAKYELDRIPEIQQELMDEGEKNPYRAYQIADRLAVIEGRHTYDAMVKVTKPSLYLSYVAKKELTQHREQLPDLTQDLMRKYDLSETASQRCAQNVLRYKEVHGEAPSAEQTDKMVQIARKLEHKNYEYFSYDRDVVECSFFQQREADLLFRNGLSHNASPDLNLVQVQVKKSLEVVQQRQMEREQEHTNQRQLSL